MPGALFDLTAHATTVLAEREIPPEWVERALRDAVKTEADRNDPTLTHALLPIAERDQRVLRVVYNATVNPLRVVTAYFDRRQRGKT